MVKIDKYGAKIINSLDFSPVGKIFFCILHLLYINMKENATNSIPINTNLQPICKPNALPLQREK